MTTFQDPQPQSRRAVRQGERGDTPEQPAAFPPPAQAAAQFYPDSATSREMWETTSRRSAQVPPMPPTPARSDASAAASGRRAAQAHTAAPPAEPLTYSTQGTPAPPAPSPTPMFRPRGTAAAAPTEQPPTQAMPAQPAEGSFRPRDFSPEGRRASSPQSWADQAPAAAPSPVVPPSDLDYRTEARLHYEVPVAPISEVPQYIAPVRPVEPVAAVQPTVDLLPASAPGLPIEQTLTRRELRAIQQAEAFAAQGPAVQAPFPSAPEPHLNTALTNAITEFDQLFQSQPIQAAPVAPAQVAPVPVAPAPTQYSQPEVAEVSTRTPPTGHWSVQIGQDGDEVHETTVNRTVGSAPATTSALVLPTIPGGHDIRGPLTRTGEIMLTGSIDLPHSLSSTGASARFDHDGIDALFDAGDAEVISTDSAPVRAVKAVSTHNSGQGVTHTQKPKGNRALTALLIAASSMAVVVAGLLITAFALNMF
ncbi:MAG: hypothetical protein ACKVOG_00330 [Rhodoglobus sp.]